MGFRTPRESRKAFNSSVTAAASAPDAENRVAPETSAVLANMAIATGRDRVNMIRSMRGVR